MKATTCFGYAENLSSGCMSENVKGEYIVTELTVGISPLHKLYVRVTSGTRFTRETYRPSGPICVFKRLL